MKLSARLLSIFLVLMMMLSLVACGGETATDAESEKPATDAGTVEDILPETEPETEAPATEPETEAPATEPETEAPATEPETEAPATEPETEAPETEPEPEPEKKPELPEGTVLSMDFETKLDLNGYLALLELEGNASLCGGTVENGSWHYDGKKPLAIKDTFGMYDLEKFTVEFDLCVKAFVTADKSSIFTFIADDDGKLNAESLFHVPLKMNKDGNVYHNSAPTIMYQLELGKVHHIRMDVDNTTGKLKLSIDGNVVVEPNYSFKTREYNCIRLVDAGKGADLTIDNLVIRDGR